MLTYADVCLRMLVAGIALVMHHLFSEFDAAVKNVNGLFKMDTIGDAYIAAAWMDSYALQVAFIALIQP
jgi:hypothetical protein